MESDAANSSSTWPTTNAEIAGLTPKSASTPAFLQVCISPSLDPQVTIFYTRAPGGTQLMRNLTNLLLGGVLTFAALPVIGQAQETAKPAAKPATRKAVLRSASELKWADIPESKGAQQAVVWGNPQKGAHGSFAKFAGGTEIPLHTHTAGSRSVVDFRDHDGWIRGPASKRTRSRLVLFLSRRSEAHYGVQGGRGVHDLYRMAGSIRPQTRDTIRSRHNPSAGTRHSPKDGAGREPA